MEMGDVVEKERECEAAGRGGVGLLERVMPNLRIPLHLFLERSRV